MTYAATDPIFVFVYYSTAGYIVGGSYTDAFSSSFFIRMGNSDTQANLVDFEEISLSLADYRTQITVKAPNGTETTGTLVMKSPDGNGLSEGTDWCLVAYVQDFGDANATIVLRRNTTFTLRKVTN